MKVILTAFGGKLKSEPIDWPEGIRYEVKMIMDMDNLDVFRTEDEPALFSNVRKIGKFVPTGHYFVLEDESTAEEFKLVEVV